MVVVATEARRCVVLCSPRTLGRGKGKAHISKTTCRPYICNRKISDTVLFSLTSLLLAVSRCPYRVREKTSLHQQQPVSGKNPR